MVRKILLPPGMIVGQIGMIKRGASYYLLSLSLRESKVHTIIFLDDDIRCQMPVRRDQLGWVRRHGGRCPH